MKWLVLIFSLLLVGCGGGLCPEPEVVFPRCGARLFTDGGKMYSLDSVSVGEGEGWGTSTAAVGCRYRLSDGVYSTESFPNCRFNIENQAINDYF